MGPARTHTNTHTHSHTHAYGHNNSTIHMTKKVLNRTVKSSVRSPALSAGEEINLPASLSQNEQEPTFNDDWDRGEYIPSQEKEVTTQSAGERNFLTELRGIYDRTRGEGTRVGKGGEVCLGSGHKVVGALRAPRVLNFWRSNGAPSHVLRWCEVGYEIEFVTTPPPAWHCSRNHPGAEEHRVWLDSAIGELVGIEAVVHMGEGVECVPEGGVVSPLNVVPKKAKDKYRLIHDLRNVNTYINAPKFKLDSLDKMRCLFSQGAWLIGADLTSGYYHCEIHPHSQKYLMFKWQWSKDIEQVGREGAPWQYFKWVALPFGLTSAPWVFSMCMRVVAARMRERGYLTIQYIDDFGWVVVGTRAEACQASRELVKLLAQFGLAINWPKSSFWPTRQLHLLGTEICTTDMTFAIPQKRVAKLIALGREMLQAGETPIRARLTAQFTGGLMSCWLVIGSEVRRGTRFIYSELARATRVPIGAPRRVLRAAWHNLMVLGEESREEIRFWLSFLTKQKRLVGPIEIARPYAAVQFGSDASDWAWGSVLDLDGRRYEAFGTLEVWQRTLASLMRELIGLEQGLRSFVHLLKNRTIMLCCDNSGAIRVLEVGSRLLHQHRVVNNIRRIALENHIRLVFQWLPRLTRFIVRCDAISKLDDNCDYALCWPVFNKLDAMFGGHTVDRAASAHNTRLPRFNSMLWHHEAEGVPDMFAHHWGGENNWVNAPWCILGRVIAYVRECRAVATVLVPVQKSAFWWPLTRRGAPGVVKVVSLPRRRDLFAGIARPLGFCPPNGVQAIRFDFS